MTDDKRPVAAMGQLYRLALASRPDWQEFDVRGALRQCEHAGWPWAKILLETAHLVARPGSEVRELLDAGSDPVQRFIAPPPGTAERGAAQARELLAAGTHG